MGIDLTNFLISFFAEANVMHSLIEDGAKFHAFIPSFMKVFLESSVKLFTGNLSGRICNPFWGMFWEKFPFGGTIPLVPLMI